MTKKVEKTTLYGLLFRNLFSDYFSKNPPCSVTKTPVTPPSIRALVEIKMIMGAFVKATRRKLSATKSKQVANKDMKSLDIKFNTLFKLFTNHLLKKIPLPTLVTLTVAEDGRVGRRFERRRKITRVQ